MSEMNDRELLEYIAAQVGTLTKNVTDLKADMVEVKKDVKNIEIKLEQDIEPKITATLDGYRQNSENIEAIREDVSVIRNIVDRHDVEILVIKGGKKKAK